MGRPSIENRRAKRKRQKKQHSIKNSKNVHETGDSPVAEAPASPLLFSDGSSPTTGNNNIVQLSSHMGTAFSSVLGDADTDLIEMEIYDLYREEDGEPYSVEYLQKCNEKLRRKVKDDKIIINMLQRQNMKMKADKKDEVERIRRFYETIAFGQSRAGKMVRTALGTSNRAQNISQQMRVLYSVHQDHYYR